MHPRKHKDRWYETLRICCLCDLKIKTGKKTSVRVKTRRAEQKLMRGYYYYYNEEIEHSIINTYVHRKCYEKFYSLPCNFPIITSDNDNTLPEHNLDNNYQNSFDELCKWLWLTLESGTYLTMNEIIDEYEMILKQYDEPITEFKLKSVYQRLSDKYKSNLKFENVTLDNHSLMIPVV
ncbi:unnamed protein product [Didymodactylos carnosus]|uniref:Uncharacterized protein n=1 Tax=Didymodactylos carnosus TaxID=1234261 RepID=A0A814IQR7_9BILA|nr:unnamed protein product [Didymodactylos carnosus]CAF3796151.1 unnamed protein product [Didymodactylos carnosus]